MKELMNKLTKEQAYELYTKINNWELNSFDIKERIELLVAIDNKFEFSKGV